MSVNSGTGYLPDGRAVQLDPDHIKWWILSKTINNDGHAPTVKLEADFNGLFGDLLCLSHEDTCIDEHGLPISVFAGMKATAFQDDPDQKVTRTNSSHPGQLSARRQSCDAMGHAGCFASTAMV